MNVLVSFREGVCANVRRCRYCVTINVRDFGPNPFTYFGAHYCFYLLIGKISLVLTLKCVFVCAKFVMCINLVVLVIICNFKYLLSDIEFNSNCI